MKPLIILSLPFTLLLIGCGTPDVVPMEGDTFFVQKRSAQVGLGPPEGARAEVYKVANQYCADRGQIVEIVDFKMVNTGLARPGSVALQFRCVSPNEQGEEREDNNGNLNLIESRLRELDQLLEKGLITKEEYTAKRDKILDEI